MTEFKAKYLDMTEFKAKYLDMTEFKAKYLDMTEFKAKYLDMTEFKAFADDKLNVTKLTIPFFDKSRKRCGKRRKCQLPAYSPSPTMFSQLRLLYQGR